MLAKKPLHFVHLTKGFAGGRDVAWVVGSRRISVAGEMSVSSQNLDIYKESYLLMVLLAEMKVPGVRALSAYALYVGSLARSEGELRRGDLWSVGTMSCPGGCASFVRFSVPSFGVNDVVGPRSIVSILSAESAAGG